MGGAEHAVLHLLYARFWHKVLYDLAHVSTPEPFQMLFNQGMIGAAAYRDERGVYVPAADVREGPETEMPDPGGASGAAGGRSRVKTTFYYEGRPVFQAFEKMSKSLKNVVNPDAIIDEYGADTLRLYEMYMGPLEKSKPWNTHDIVGVHRFLQRVWRLVVAEERHEGAEARGHEGNGPRSTTDGAHVSACQLNPRISDARDAALERLLHKTIKKVQADIDRFAFNTAIAQMIVWVNDAQKAERIGRDQIERFLLVLAPFAPHIAEELWHRLGRTGSVTTAAWPVFDEALTRDDTVEIAVQVKGKLRGRITVAAEASEDDLVAAARALEPVAREIGDQPIKRAIVAKGRLINLIV
jgi:leucyl-tRNA synthetase